MKQIRRRSSAKGFTLIELLVVITIIGILAAIAIPGISSALETARRNSATQNAKGLGNVFSAYAADNDQNYPSAKGNKSTGMFDNLITGKYLPNGDAAFITGVTGKVKFPGGAIPIDTKNVCWDYMSASVADPADAASKLGLNSSEDDNLPLLFSDLGAAGGYVPATAVVAEATMGADAVFKQTGVVVLYKSMGARFVKADPAAAGKTTGFQTANFQGVPANYNLTKP